MFNLELCFAEAKAAALMEVAGWRALSATVNRLAVKLVSTVMLYAISYLFRLNMKAEDTTIRRPNGHIYRMQQRQMDCSVGFVKVKTKDADSPKCHEDMVRLVAFCKDAVESKNSQAMIAVQVVGKN
ncbi:hypothetical protein DFQ28_005402 [Apophysomyces sp. BC1034]|nr:hypothetical protein DFQ30_010985 [Apophysomyces sp. BC1015]KAG0182297.1 hypothetical protein DFQ29_004850 [Apophysomyces sp. BC1021]KAG0193398.1 hypothetical protein DFQ28_005402 [Apophysomyces sp. BC1034]